jgi:hypothetical protein
MPSRRQAVLAEAKRILRIGGRLAVMLYTREDIEDLWFLQLFPSTLEWDGEHPSASGGHACPAARRSTTLASILRQAGMEKP